MRRAHLLLLVFVAVFAFELAAGSVALCDAEGECRQAPPTEGLLLGLEHGLEVLMEWVGQSASAVDVKSLLAEWAAPGLVVEANSTPNVPWRGRYVGVDSAAAFFRRLRRGLFPTLAAEGATGTAALNVSRGGLQRSTAAIGAGGYVVRWTPAEQSEIADVKRTECEAWLVARADDNGRLEHLAVNHAHSLACAAAFRTRAQLAFDGAFAHFFRLDYAAFRQSFAPDVVFTWHGDAPLGKLFHGNHDGLSEFIKTRVQIFLQTSVEFEPIVADETSASYYVVFRPLTLRATGQDFGEVRGLLVIGIDEASGLISQYQMTLLDHRVNGALARYLASGAAL